jgi:hypothetical protein
LADLAQVEAKRSSIVKHENSSPAITKAGKAPASETPVREVVKRSAASG